MLRKAMLLGVFLAMVVCICAASSNNTTGTTNISQAAKAIETVSSKGASTAPPNSIEKGAPLIVSGSGNGIATKYWAELVPVPTGPKRLDLYVTGVGWLYLSNPSDSTLDLVQDAFTHVPNQLQVQVWYTGTNIVGLVVHN